MAKQGITGQAATYIMASVRSGTASQYQTHIKKWRRFCDERQYNRHYFSVAVIVEFLTYLKDDQGLSYKSVAVARAALGNYAVMVNAQNEGITQHPFVTKLMKGMANLHPPIKKYQQIWNPQQVLEYIKSLPDNADLTLRQLTLKLVMLAALVTGSRCQSLHQIRRSRWTKMPTCFCCNMPVMLKTGKYDKKEQVLHLPKYPDTKLCVFTTLEHYLEHTKPLRKDEDKLFIITRAPYGPAAQSTVSGWVTTCMAQAGIDVSLYTTHSTRKASTSQASTKSIPLASILRAAGWSNADTFAAYYKLPVTDHSSFANAVLEPSTPGAVHVND